MKRNSFLIGAAFLALLSGCVPAVSQTSGLTRDDVVKIVNEQMSGDTFNAKVADGIEAYIAEQEAKAKKEAEEANKPKKVDNPPTVDDDPFLGDENAPVTIIEFSDFECPFCGRHVAEVYPKLKEKYIDTGKVKYVFRDFPLSFHPDALPAAIAANCVLEQGGNKEYFAFHDKLFANQKGLTRDNFIKYAKDLGLNADAFTACLDANDTTEIDKDIKDGSDAGITGTPGFFINGWNIKGAYPFETFQEIIDQELTAQ